MAILKQSADLHSSSLTQQVVHRVLSEPGFLDAHLRTLRTTYFGEGTHRPADLVLMGMHKIDIAALQRAHAQA